MKHFFLVCSLVLAAMSCSGNNASTVDASRSTGDASQPTADASQPAADASQPTTDASPDAGAVAGVLFHSDWSTALGNTNAALLDTDKAIPWQATANPADHLHVVAAAAYFPTAGFANCLVAQLQDNVTASVAVNFGGAGPAVGGSRYWRAYLYVDYPDATSSYVGGGNHPTADYCGGCGDSESNRLWVMHLAHSQGSSKVDLYFQMEGGQGPPYDIGSVLSARTPYRIEVKATKATASTYTMDVRVYAESGTTPLYTGSDFIARYGTKNAMTAATFTLPASPSWSSFVVGTNGVTGWPGAGETISHVWGGACVCANDWCGPYRNGT